MATVTRVTIIFNSREGEKMIEKWFCDWTPSERWPHYTRANAGEVLATPATPLGQTYSWENAMLQGLSLIHI